MNPSPYLTIIIKSILPSLPLHLGYFCAYYTPFSYHVSTYFQGANCSLAQTGMCAFLPRTAVFSMNRGYDNNADDTFSLASLIIH